MRLWGPAWSAASRTEASLPSPVRWSPPHASAVLLKMESVPMCCAESTQTPVITGALWESLQSMLPENWELNLVLSAERIHLVSK